MKLRRYLRVNAKNGSRTPKGLVCIDLDMTRQTKVFGSFGWSLCDNYDQFSYTEAKRIADDRMEKEDQLLIDDIFNTKELVKIRSQIPHTLHDTFDKLIRQTWTRLRVNPVCQEYRKALEFAPSIP